MTDVSSSDRAFEPDVTLGDILTVFGRIGLISFGGPAGQIALMHRMIVEERGWLDETRFLHALNYCMLLPGPEAMQLATYVGWLKRGVPGGLLAGLLFLLPGAVVIVALSALYMSIGQAPLVEGLLFGLKAAVVAIVIEAMVRVSRRALKRGQHVAIALLAFISIALLAIPFPIVILAAGAIGALMGAGGKAADLPATDGLVEPTAGSWTRPTLRRFLSTSAIWLSVWLLPLAIMFLMLGGDDVFVQEAGFFSIMATVTFGGAYAVLAYVAQQAVEVYGWLRPDEMLTGLGLAESTPGPLILVLAFVGYLGGARLSGLDPLTGGIAGAVTALWFTFVPCFLWIFAGAPYVERVRHVRWLSAALSGVTAAVVGVIANLAVWFALQVFFREVGTLSAGPLEIPVPNLASVDLAAVLIALVAGIALLRFHVNIFLVLGGAMAAGMALRLAGIG